MPAGWAFAPKLWTIVGGFPLVAAGQRAERRGRGHGPTDTPAPPAASCSVGPAPLLTHEAPWWHCGGRSGRHGLSRCIPLAR